MKTCFLNLATNRPLLLLVGVLILLSCEKPKHPPETYEVARVVNGDTIKIMYEGEQESVRLIGVDTPETVHPTKPVEPFGKEASYFLTNLLIGEMVSLQFGKEKHDKYGRLLAYVYRAPDGLFVNLEIVRQGYGRVYTREKFKHRDLFLRAETEAKEAKRGLWSDF